MKQSLAILCAIFMALPFAGAQISSPAPSPSCELHQDIGLTKFVVKYSRPGMKDRTIFAADGLVPFGQIWRTGANQSTTIEFDKDIVFGGEEVEAGTYAIYTIPNKDNWDVMLYSDLTLGGYVENYDESKEVVRVKADVQSMNGALETFSIDFGDIRDGSATLDFYWENTWASVPIKLHTHKQMMAQIDQFTGNPMGQVASNYLNSGWYLYTAEDGDKERALEYISAGCEHTTSPYKYYWLERKAQIQAANGDYAGAVATCKEAHKHGKTAPENARGFYENTVKAQLDQNINEWSGKM